MSRSDLVADSLTMIRNSVQRNKKTVDIINSSLLGEIVVILKREGFINNYRHIKGIGSGKLRLYLRYGNEGNSFILGIKRISKPGCRVYKKADEIPEVLNGLGICIVTTSKGVVTGKNAKELDLGGEIICYVW